MPHPQRKIIPTPGPVLEIQINSDILDKKRRQWLELKSKHQGYVLLQQPNDISKPPEFEPEAEDLRFLQSIFPEAMDQSRPLPPSIMSTPIVVEFMKLIEYIETTNDLKFTNYSVTCNDYNEGAIKDVVKYWHEKTQRNKYLFHRRLWRESLTKKQFGPMNPHRLAFQNSNEEKKKQIRVHRKTTNFDIWQQVMSLDKNWDHIERAENLAIKREKLKRTHVIMMLGLSEKTGTSKDFLADLEKDIKAAESITEKIIKLERANSPPKESPSPLPAPPVIVQESFPSVPKNMKVPENEISYLVSTVLSELNKYNIMLSEIKVSNIHEINKKIRTLRNDYNATVPVSVAEKQINLSLKHQTPTTFMVEKYGIYKRFGCRNSNDVYIQKMEKSAIEQERNGEHGGNFQYDYIVRGNPAFLELAQNFTHFSLNVRAGINPDVYNEANTNSTSNIPSLTNRNMRNSKLFLGVTNTDSERSNEHYGGAEYLTVQKQAEQEMSTLNLKAGFQAWKSGSPTKRIKQA